MDEMSVRLGDGTNLGEASSFDLTNMPSLFGGVDGVKNQKCEGPEQGGDQWLFEKIKVFKKNQKHEPNIVEVTHLCIMHRVHSSCM